MLVEPKVAGPVAAVLVASGLLLCACSSSHPRDINLGTDAAVGFVPPDTGTLDTSSAPVDVSLDTGAVDAGEQQLDASLDTNT